MHKANMTQSQNGQLNVGAADSLRNGGILNFEPLCFFVELALKFRMIGEVVFNYSLGLN